MGEEKQGSFHTSLPGILSGLAALITAGVGAYALIGQSRDAPPSRDGNQSSDGLAPEPDVGNNASAALVDTVEPAPPPSATPAPVADPFNATAVLDDPDGFVNVRANANAQSRIVAVVRLNETVRTYPQAGAWWLVRTRSGSQGYVHASRIRLIEG